MRFLKIIVDTSLLAALCLPLSVQAQEATISINARSDQTQPVIIVRSKYNFERRISLKMKTDPALSASDVLIRAISKVGMVDAHGIKITSGFDVDAVNNLVVAFSGGTSEIIRTLQLPNGFQVVGSFKDRGGNFVSPPVGSLAVYNTSGEKLCFDYETAAQAKPKMVFMLLVDRSGSMFDVMDDVKTSAKAFLKSLPPTAMCAVSSFSDSFTYHNERYENCNGGVYKIDDLVADGGTQLYTPLLRAYQSLTQDYFKDYQKAVIIITDGQVPPNPILRNQALAAKQDVLSFVYFLGEKEEAQLSSLADVFLQSTSDIKNNLNQYFDALSTAYKTQTVLNVRQCQGGVYANP
tara:strand:+ start:1980 stop:3029 length:1050 start_codon:yes stop_codon:yes gene_type:complete